MRRSTTPAFEARRSHHESSCSARRGRGVRRAQASLTWGKRASACGGGRSRALAATGLVSRAERIAPPQSRRRSVPRNEAGRNTPRPARRPTHRRPPCHSCAAAARRRRQSLAGTPAPPPDFLGRRVGAVSLEWPTRLTRAAALVSLLHDDVGVRLLQIRHAAHEHLGDVLSLAVVRFIEGKPHVVATHRHLLFHPLGDVYRGTFTDQNNCLCCPVKI